MRSPAAGGQDFWPRAYPGWEDDGVDQLYEVRPVEWSGLYYSSFEDESLAFAVLAGVLGVGDDRR
jgi:hypothetical protein